MSEKDNMNHNELENEVEKVDDKDVVVDDVRRTDGLQPASEYAGSADVQCG